MNNDAIGVFDSGIGGLTAVKELNKLLPNENIQNRLLTTCRLQE